jgi:hypothetical protein
MELIREGNQSPERRYIWNCQNIIIAQNQQSDAIGFHLLLSLLVYSLSSAANL